jgi:hypothetical protein
MKRSTLASLILAALLFVSFAAVTPAKAYDVTVSGCTITISIDIALERPTGYKIGPVENEWPYDSFGRPLPSVSETMPASGTYVVQVIEDGDTVLDTLVTVTCDTFPAEPLDPAVTGDGDPDLVVDTIVLIKDTDGVIREGQAFARLLRPTYLGNRDIINIPYIRAADVFVFFKGQTYKGNFYTPLRVCLRGNGRLLFGSVQGRPRRFTDAVIAPNTGRRAFQCAWLIEPGTLALVERR